MTDLTQPRRSQPKVGRAVLLGVAITAVLAGGGVLAYLVGGQIFEATSSGPPFTINGSVTLGSGAYIAEDRMGAPCEGDGGYSDIHAGTQVAVRNAEGDVVAVGRLEQGYSSILATCTANFTITEVPGDQKFYGITVGNRNELQYSKDQLTQRVELTLG